MSERVQQLESQIQGKLEQARERRETIEREQKEKLRNHVSFRLNVAFEVNVVALGSTFLSDCYETSSIVRYEKIKLVCGYIVKLYETLYTSIFFI